MAPHSSTLAWKIPWMEEAGRLRSMGSLRVGHEWSISFSLFTLMHWEGNGNPLQCSCLEDPRTVEPGGLLSMGLHRVGHDWSNLAAAAAADFLMGLFLLSSSCMSCLYILEIKPLLVTSFADIFYQSIGCLFVYGFFCCIKACKFD